VTSLRSRLLGEVQEILRGYESWDGEIVKSREFGRGQWRIWCGEGRFEPDRRNGAYAKRTRVALNFQITGQHDALQTYEICVTWPAHDTHHVGWQLMFHFDPQRAAWPDHPEHHLQVSATRDAEPPPFAHWRIPLGITDPAKFLEFVQLQVA